jgi:glycerophosphoryl diester phosphodiesterase
MKKRKAASYTLIPFFAAALLLFFQAAPGLTREQKKLIGLDHYNKPLIVGHRGGAGLRPENTLAAFKKACELAVDAIELDVLVSADGQIVVHHDFKLKPEIARSSDGSWIAPGSNRAIKDLTLSQLKSYDIGRLQPKTFYSARFPDQIAVDGERIPTLKEVIDLFTKSCPSSSRIIIEIKTSPEEPALTLPPESLSEKVVKMVREEAISHRVWIISFDWRNLLHIQKIAPEITTAYLTIDTSNTSNLQMNQPGASPWLAGLDIDNFNGSAPRAVKAAGGRIWSPYFKNLTQENLKEARRLGLGVSVWTPDHPDDLKKMIEMNVEAITTNRPDILKIMLSP